MQFISAEDLQPIMFSYELDYQNAVLYGGKRKEGKKQ